MADILNDDPDEYAADPQIQDGGAVDVAMADEFRASLRSLNRLARGRAGLPGYNIRSVHEFGAVGDGATNDYRAFRRALRSFTPLEGGTLLIPPGTYLIDLGLPPGPPFVILHRRPLTIPHAVHVKGAGIGRRGSGVTVLEFRFTPQPGHPSRQPPIPGIRFAPGDNYGRLSNLILRGNSAAPAGIGLSFAGSQFNVATDLQVWDFPLGVDMSDGRSDFSAYNELSNFLVSVCGHGIRCHRFGNGNWIERGRVFWSFGQPDAPGTGVGIDVNGATALSIRSVAIESANTCLRFGATADSDAEPPPTALATCEVSCCYFEPGALSPPPGERSEDPPPPGPRDIFDISYPSSDLDPDGRTSLRLNANWYEGNIGRLDVPPEALADFDAPSESPFGARTHFAAHAHRQFSENHDLRMYSPPFIPGGWEPHFEGELSENTTDFFSGGRTLGVTRTAGPNDGIEKRIRVPEDVGWVTVGFRYKNIRSTSINYSARSGGFGGDGRVSVNGADTEPASNVATPGAGYRERWLQLPKARGTDDDDIVVATIEVDHGLNVDHGPNGVPHILVDAIWCVSGRVRTADFRYEQRVQYLERPPLVVTGTQVVANEEWSVDWTGSDWTELGGLATVPRGAIGAILSIQITATGSDNGLIIPRPIYVTVSAPAEAGPGSHARVYAEYDNRPTIQQIAVRPSSSAPTTLSGSFVTELGVDFPASYQIYIVGWILG